MATPKIGILGQSKGGAGANVDAYTCPAGRRAVISTLTCAETGAAATTVRVFARINGAAAAVGNAVAYDTDIAAKGHIGFTEGWTLAPGDVITVQSASGSVAFTAFGEETDVPTA
jgi:hypothetical protein